MEADTGTVLKSRLLAAKLKVLAWFLSGWVSGCTLLDHMSKVINNNCFQEFCNFSNKFLSSAVV